MIRRLSVFSLIPLAVFLLCQCGSKVPGPVLLGQGKEHQAEGAAIFRKAEAKERKGSYGRAAKLYNEVATDFPAYDQAGEARYREGKMLDKEGDYRDAVKAYGMFLNHYPGHPQHSAVIKRVFEIATGAKEGEIRTNFLGIKGNLPVDVTAEMLGTVKKYAPKSDLAAKAQYAIGETYLREAKSDSIHYSQAVTAFRRVADEHRNHRLAPEALFKVGEILLDSANRGNQNQATLDLSREAFNDYLIQFPGHKRNGEARKMIVALKSRDLERSMNVAEFYYKTGNMESAKIYYRDIVKKSKSGALHEKAKARLKEIGN